MDRHDPRLTLVFLFARLQLPAVVLSQDRLIPHLERMFDRASAQRPGLTLASFLDRMYAVDSYLAAGCLEGNATAWELLFAARAGSADRLLIDALRLRAARFFPRNEERQESAVAGFWGKLLVAEPPGSMPILARYDGQRPLVPWLIRTFHNVQVSELRGRHRVEELPEDDLLPDHDLVHEPDDRWRELFRQAAQHWLAGLADPDLLLLGLRTRYRLSQREAAHLLGVHEGTISRRISQLRDSCLEQIGRQLVRQGWTGHDLSGYVLGEMGSLLLEEPRLTAAHLARLLAAQGLRPPLEAAAGQT